MADYGLVAPKFLEFKADDGTTLYGQLLLPPKARPAGKIPLIVYVYGGPAAQLVSNEWGGPTYLFHEILRKRASPSSPSTIAAPRIAGANSARHLITSSAESN